jgi:hypothetical protein
MLPVMLTVSAWAICWVAHKATKAEVVMAMRSSLWVFNMSKTPAIEHWLSSIKNALDI